jgi:hypothetical protein
MNNYLHVKALLFGLLLCQLLPAQTTLQVATKHLQKTLDWKPEYVLVVNCEKADVVIEPSEQATVEVDAELSARHPNADTAQLDVNCWQMLAERSGKQLFVRSYIGLNNQKKTPSSNFKSKIRIRTPLNCKVELSNKFGKTTVTGLAGDLQLNGSFCNFQLSHLSGKVAIESQYGAVNTKQLNGTVSVKAKRADVQIDSLSGSGEVYAEYGTVTVNYVPEMANLTVNGDKTNVILLHAHSIGHSYDLNTDHGQITVPGDFERKETATRQVASKPATNNLSKHKVAVYTTFGNIILTQ